MKLIHMKKNVHFRFRFSTRHVSPLTDEEYANVLDSYKQLCVKLRVRPCQKLVDQLEGLRDSTLKLDTIDLKGGQKYSVTFTVFTIC